MPETKTDDELAAEQKAALEQAAALPREIAGRQLIRVQAFVDAVAAGDIEAARSAADGLPDPAASYARNWLTVTDGVPGLIAGEISRLQLASSPPVAPPAAAGGGPAAVAEEA
ncbi:hypothetical protein [Brevundimonas sp.]|uniref:hypothetical protein n=1 Tax=Brevundimonas sp. TaxID=1871086 RepID=UPI0025B98E3C|nr:hypothetical protein [Brevundimonas sp.]MCG2665048.1 hypothetical protein [Brevundimonas sp.]